MRQLLKLQHHQHTGKLLHHRHTSYRALALLFIVAGFFMVAVGVANHAAAATFGVSAMVEPPIPSTPPIVASPASGTEAHSSSMLVVGSCPIVTPQVVVRVRVDGTTAGTGACDSNNDFSIPITLDSGSHQITANTITIAGQQGPSSSPILIATWTTATKPATILTPTDPFIYLGADKIATWTGQISGSNVQHVHIDWGDGSQSNLTVQPGSQSFTHQYATLTSKNIWLAVADASNTATSEQFAVAAYTTTSSVVPAAASTPLNSSTMVGLYGLYITAVSVTAVIWLEAKHAARTHAWQHMPI